MIQNLTKTEVYEISKYLVRKYIENGDESRAKALRKCIEIAPTDGLGITDTDLDQIGASTYEEADQILHDYIVLKKKDVYNHPTVLMHERNRFKGVSPYNVKREDIFPGEEDFEWKLLERRTREREESIR